MTSTGPHILLTGATGYIGGTVLTNFLSSSAPILKNATITLLVRGSSRVETLTSTYGSRVNTILYEDLDDAAVTTAAAAKADLVVNAGPGFHFPSAEALIRGLAQRKKATGKDVWFIQTSGTSNLADRPYTKTYVEQNPEREFDDAADDIYGYEVEREKLEPYFQRTTELGVIDLGLELGVKTVVIMSPQIFGQGTGLFNTASMLIPTVIRGALDHGHVVVAGEGHGVWDHVHIQDLASLYEIITLDILEQNGTHVPSGKKGIIFSGNGRHSWKQVAQKIADVLANNGKIKTREVESVSLKDITKLLSFTGFELTEGMAELGLTSNSRTVSSVGRRLGWKPTRGEEAWESGFQEDLEAVLKARK